MGNAWPLSGGATDEAALKCMANQTTSAWGGVDVLVTGCGFTHAPSAGSAADPFRVERSVEGDLVGAFAASKIIGSRKVAAGGGAVVNVTAATGPVGQRGADARAVAAGGVAMLSRSLACEWASVGVRVNTAAVGPFTPGDAVASAVAFLGSEAASYVTGSLITLD